MQGRADKPTLVFEWLEQERVAVVCQNAETPSPAEWRAYLDLLRRLSAFEHRVLLYTEVHLTREQQAELAAATKSDKPPRVAVVSPSTAVRFVASIFTMLNRNVRFFAPDHLEAAMAHLGCCEEQRQRVLRSYRSLMNVVAVEPSASRAAAK